MPQAALSLGSNLSDREATLCAARRLIEARGPIRLLATSPLFETEPVEGPPQPWFLNQVLLVECSLSPEALLALAFGVESSLGRLRRARRGPRTLDVDLLFFEGIVRRTRSLELPHPALARRRSTLVPLAAVAPSWRHPLLGRTVEELLAACTDPACVRLWPPPSP